MATCYGLSGFLRWIQASAPLNPAHRLRKALRGPEIKVPPFQGGTYENILLAGRYLSTAASASQVQRRPLFLLADESFERRFPPMRACPNRTESHKKPNLRVSSQMMWEST